MSRGARSALLALAAVAIAVVAFVALRPGGDAEPAPAPPADNAGAGTPTRPRAPAPAPTPLVRVRGGEPVGGVVELSARSGGRVRFAVVSDAAEELHVHGVDLYRDLAAGRRTVVSFPAEVEGVFEVELHGSGRQVAELTISP